jgi:hypothetical protein
MDKLKQSFADMVANSKLTDFVQNIIGWLSKPENIKNMLNGIKNFFVMVADVTGKIIGNILRFINAFTHNIDESLIQTVLGAGEQMKSFDMGNLAGTASVGNAAAAGTVAASPSANNNNNTQANNNNKISGVNLAVYNTIEPFSGRVMTQALNKDTGIKHDGTKMQ